MTKKQKELRAAQRKLQPGEVVRMTADLTAFIHGPRQGDLVSLIEPGDYTAPRTWSISFNGQRFDRLHFSFFAPVSPLEALAGAE